MPPAVWVERPANGRTAADDPGLRSAVLIAQRSSLKVLCRWSVYLSPALQRRTHILSGWLGAVVEGFPCSRFTVAGVPCVGPASTSRPI